MPNDDRNRIADLEEKLSLPPVPGVDPGVEELELLADLYLHADSYVPALETIEQLLQRPGARRLSADRRASLELKAVSCRLARGDSPAALSQCRELLLAEADIESTAVRSTLHLKCSQALLNLARYDEARERGRRALSLADGAGEMILSAHAVNQLGRIAYREGDLLQARDLYEQALALYRRFGDEHHAAWVRNNLGLIHKTLCEWDAAAAQLRSALEVYRRLGRFAETGSPLLNLGIVYHKAGEWDRALEHYREAEHVFLQVGDHGRATRVTIGIANVARVRRQFVEAETLLLSALERARAHDARREEALALEFLGELEADRGRPELALARYHEALSLAEVVAPRGDLIVELERRRAEALCQLQRLDEAAEACERARRQAHRTDDRYEHAVSYRVAGEIAWARGTRDEAVRLWGTAARLLGDCRERFELGKTLLALGRSSDDWEMARRHLYRASALFAELSAPYWLEQAEQELRRVMGPAAPVAAAPAQTVMGRRHRAPTLVAGSHLMQRVEAMARRAAATELAVLITGETGTGKELIARTIHSLSSRAGRPFLAVNCGALRADLALSQLFGHRKGAFTGAHADGVGLVEASNGGTLFLDEVGELPGDVQVTLLRFLESGEYLRLGESQVRRADVRVIAATNRELRGEDGSRAFRRDLLFRLNEIEIRLPALRERPEDILPLARHFEAFYGGMNGPRLTPDAASILRTYPWPGNVRELENVMKRVVALHGTSSSVDASQLLSFLTGFDQRFAGDRRTEERRQILDAIESAQGNKSRVARMLGVSRKTLYARLKRLGIDSR